MRTGQSTLAVSVTMLAAALAAQPAIAQTGTEKPAAIGGVVVTATRTATTVERMPLHTTILSRDDIKRSPAQSLDQLLREVPGMNIPGAPFYTTDPTGHQTRLRGVTNSKVLMLLDGIPIHDPFYSTTQWFKVPLSSIERVEIVRGGASSLWGNLAVAGVVNIITRKPIDNSGELDASVQSMSTRRAALAQNVVLPHGIALRLSGDVLDAGGYQTTPSEFLSALPGKSASSATNGNLQLAAYFTPFPDVTAFLRAGYHRQNEDIGGYAFGTNLQESPDAAAGVTRLFGEHGRAEVRAWAQRVSFDKYNGAGCYLASAASCNATTVAAPLVQYANSHDDNPYHELGASTVLSSTMPSRWMTSVQAGADFRRLVGEDLAMTYNRPTTIDPASAMINRTSVGGGTQQFVGVFTQLGATPLPGLETTLSLRLDTWENTRGIAQMTRYTGGAPGATLGGAIADSRSTTFNPSLALRYDLTGAISARAATYRAFRAPGLNNLYRSFSSTTSITLANAELRPETLVGGEFGGDLRLDALVIGVTAFQYDTRALIASYRVLSAATAPAQVIAVCGATLANCPTTVNFNTNGQDARSRGVELVGDWKVAPSLHLAGGYTYTDSHYLSTTTGDPVGMQLGAIPKHLATLSTNWRATTHVQGGASLRYNGAMYLDVNQTIAQRAFTVLDLNGSFQATRALELHGSVTNVTDVAYADNATTSAASKTLGMPRAFATGVRWHF